MQGFSFKQIPVKVSVSLDELTCINRALASVGLHCQASATSLPVARQHGEASVTSLPAARHHGEASVTSLPVARHHCSLLQRFQDDQTVS